MCYCSSVSALLHHHVGIGEKEELMFIMMLCIITDVLKSLSRYIA